LFGAWSAVLKPKLSIQKKGGYKLPPKRRAYRYFTADRTGSDFAFRSLES